MPDTDTAGMFDGAVELGKKLASSKDARNCYAGKWLVVGRGTGGRIVQVVYSLDADGTAFIIHAMPVGGRRGRRKRRN